MNFDLRLPLGLIFTLFGGMLTVFGALGSGGTSTRSLGINLNLDWGVVVLLFGAWMLFLSLRARSRRHNKEG